MGSLPEQGSQRRAAKSKSRESGYDGLEMMRNAIAVPCLALGGLLAAVSAGPRARAEGSPPMADVRFITLDPGHFHAALVQKEMYPGVSERVDVYAPLGPDLTEHLNRIVAFNTRSEMRAASATNFPAANHP